MKPSSSYEVLTHIFQELLDKCKKYREEQMTTLKDMYNRLVGTLKTASTLIGTSCDTAPDALVPHLHAAPDLSVRMKPFLDHWKDNVQEAITE